VSTQGRIAAGAGVASILSGAWRVPASPWTGTADELRSLTPLLLHGGCAALAWRRLSASDHRTADAARPLQQAYRLQALRAVVHEGEVRRSFALLRSRGVEPVLGKGWAAARLYPDPALRPYGDVDLYLGRDEEGAAREAIAAPGAGCPIDLHPGFGELDDRGRRQIEERAVLVDLGGCAVRVFGAEDHLRLLCLHALRHGLLRPLWLCDVAAAVEGRPATFDWDRFRWGDAKRTRWAMTAVGLAHRLLGARLDDAPEGGVPAWLLPSVLREWGSARPAHGARRPMADALRHPAALAGAMRARWPNAVEATVGVRGSFGDLPRLPYQIAECARRSLNFVAGASGAGGGRL
jgi:hypothetical protein